MVFKMLIDPGHNREFDNRVGTYSEATTMLALAKVIKAYGESNYMMQIDLTRTTMDPLVWGSNSADLSARAARSKGYDLFYSVHSDASGDKAVQGGTLYGDINPANADHALFTKIAAAVAAATGTKTNGVRYRSGESSWSIYQKPTAGKSNYYAVLREGQAKVALLMEHGFHTNAKEADLLRSIQVQNKIAMNVIDTIASHYKIPRRFATQTPIMGKPTTTIDQMQAYVIANKANNLAVDLAPLFWEIAVKAGVDPAVIFAQSCKETGFYNFGGVLDASFKNPCGLKTAMGGSNDDPNAHQRFATWEQGIIAQADHLALYAGAPGYPKASTPDPRQFASIKGVAQTVEQLGGPGRWAPSLTYGTDIVRRMKDLTSTPTKESTPVETKPVEKKPLDVAQQWAVDAGIMADRRWDEPLTKQETAWVLRDLVRKVIQK